MDLYDADADGVSGVRDLFSRASAILGSDIRDLLNADAEILKQTDVSQVAITVASLAAVRALESAGTRPAACAGFSLGEYPALATAGVITEEDAIRLTIARGKIMQKVCDALSSNSDPAAGTAGMAAVIGLSPEKINETIASSCIDGLWGANYNSPLQTVVSGTAGALAKAEEAFKAAGARRVIRLKVAGPFHSPLMAAAGEEFGAVLQGVQFADPRIPLFSNVTGRRVETGAEAKRCAVAHISQAVRWTDEEAAIAAFFASSPAVLNLVEVGPGKVLTGLWADSKQNGLCVPYADILREALASAEA
jgi:[acyl-carrier-protein] S-malonyltransferase